jgi:hypothetical protein
MFAPWRGERGGSKVAQTSRFERIQPNAEQKCHKTLMLIPSHQGGTPNENDGNDWNDGKQRT